MNLGAVLVVAFGPALSACQTAYVAGDVVPTATAGSSMNEQDDWSPGFLAQGSSECVKMPQIPQIFRAKRTFFSFFNTIVFEDRHGKEFGFVESWFGDWKNPFGYPGASFFLKAEPSEGQDGVWNINGPTTGEDGTFANNGELTQEGLAQNEDDMFGTDSQNGQTLNTNQVNNNQVQSENSGGFFEHFFRGFSKNDHHRLAAFMVGKHDGPVGAPFEDEMTIRDCHGQAQVKAKDGTLIFRNAADSRYYQKLTDTENVLIIKDLGQPPVDLVRVTLKEPCHPFPPFCAKMGMWNWLIHGLEWEGRVVAAGTTNDMGSILPGTEMTVSMSSGESEDMRFLTLYSAYQFSNTRWSPFMNWVWLCLAVFPFICCLYRCCCGSSPKEESKAEETEKLMQTMEATSAPVEKQEARSFMNCCSRRGGGRTVAAGFAN